MRKDLPKPRHTGWAHSFHWLYHHWPRRSHDKYCHGTSPKWLVRSVYLTQLQTWRTDWLTNGMKHTASTRSKQGLEEIWARTIVMSQSTEVVFREKALCVQPTESDVRARLPTLRDRRLSRLSVSRVTERVELLVPWGQCSVTTAVQASRSVQRAS